MKIFIIHLNWAKDRKDSMLEQIDKLRKNGFEEEIIFFDAIDAKKGEQHRFDKYYSSFLSKIYRARDATDGEIACYASHFSLWCECVKLDEPIVILEDDVELLDCFLEGFCRIKESSYEYVRLMALDEPKKPFTMIEKNFATTYDDIAGAQGYYLTPNAAKKFIDGSKYWILAVDNFMDKIYMHGVKTVLHIPYLIAENPQVSVVTTIPNRYDKKIKKSLFWKAIREIVRPYLVCKHILYLYRFKD
ncbi:glycosyltransferase family 25 protein [Helicobacter sp. 13S00477-4]|uniref:glycosyltransferase family 25 protein n=1 Tax=Helicobacter sp. 13S00477-4 TaxID=1905759 RepID=UPI000BA5E89E|nr:glycosyltransferase family 25 protein [Helicobacter sp. 13S00477-4]PAF51551.1 hypothetical protein BKH44_05780 [Helicobacter sp. 13S00477-4]